MHTPKPPASNPNHAGFLKMCHFGVSIRRIKTSHGIRRMCIFLSCPHQELQQNPETYPAARCCSTYAAVITSEDDTASPRKNTFKQTLGRGLLHSPICIKSFTVSTNSTDKLVLGSRKTKMSGIWAGSHFPAEHSARNQRGASENSV